MYLKNIHNLVSQVVDFATLVKNLPGRVLCKPQVSDDTDRHIIDITGYDAKTDEEAFACKLGFSFGNKESRIKNFSIHDPAQRGQGIGAQLISNLIEVVQSTPDLEQISLTAELERGALVWLKMGWLPEPASFAKLQKKCLPKLDALQQLLPAGEKLSPTTYGIFRDLLDHQSTTDTTYAWAIADSGASYGVTPLKEIQKIANIADKAERYAAIAERAKTNGIEMSGSDVQKADKALAFMRELDLDNLSREGKIKVSATLLAWESWKGALKLDNPLQMHRIGLVLDKVNGSSPTVSIPEIVVPARPDPNARDRHV